MISVIILTRNEEDRIKACLESVKWADEIIVADNDSTDKTLEVVKKYTDKVFVYKGQDFAQLRNMAMGKVSGDWVFYVDADERVLKPLREEVEEITQKGDKSAYAVSRRNIIFGQEVNYGPYKDDWMVRLFKRDKFKAWVGKVHEYGTFEGNLGYTKNSLLHLTHRNIDHFILKSLEWSKIDAKLRLETQHPKMTKWRFLRIFLTELYHQGIKRRGFLSGTVGIIDSILQVFFFYMTYVRLWEMQQTKPLEEEYKEIDQKLMGNDFQY
ncbi:MAG: Glycosyl transferase family 2 [Candidatus Daviesbacteria bacterium GW2011_GWA1_41_61]|uniref:Glycosyl transferase family 2 n=1 Tax=Candidatus Daviesbacteria bacterium GW2011_GWA2_40_9 TaxID=1618424 RepID=A0A0G0U5U7_9BACT|nr:MAG: glycosyl transferase family 2 [Candidatus Daviesbacteria bacterium GW2011_GWC1_40_9]KKR82561.1 MAG: Glycosyl transferase family 2 [Candidatus Daviesbacteria bacterium GW2011_GWA2_40_9]KKR93013.1 MAG: Glycosyl transferase family 2 [Candidatus Daviesbacteria bacterium GW2011_GWB1_41_15]KKS15557.1 MAG: Glycosyl transferase family 2 [Candidatus Daviesbacteria bacterium GW2011_GWA1_41_61]